jgi:hypothetical protein
MKTSHTSLAFALSSIGAQAASANPEAIWSTVSTNVEFVSVKGGSLPEDQSFYESLMGSVL